jgi:hypothetical protein
LLRVRSPRPEFLRQDALKLGLKTYEPTSKFRVSSKMRKTISVNTPAMTLNNGASFLTESVFARTLEPMTATKVRYATANSRA